jgi:hypothetical protein
MSHSADPRLPRKGSSTPRDGRRGLGDAGTATVETALVGGILLMLALGIVEFGTAYSAAHTLSGLSREGANLAARGTSLGESIEVTMENGSDLGLSARGGAIASRIVMEDGTPVLEEQVASGSYAGQSRIGNAGDEVPSAAGWGMRDGQIVYVMEVFYDYEAVTPFNALTGVVVPEVLYERAIF